MGISLLSFPEKASFYPFASWGPHSFTELTNQALLNHSTTGFIGFMENLTLKVGE